MQFVHGCLVALVLAAFAVAPARAQTGFDRPGGDYAHFTVQSGDPAVYLGSLWAP